jgi:hypothetical protein
MPLPRPVPPTSPPPVKVQAKNETIAKFIKHPYGTKFNKDGIASWPDDAFTFRRVRDGDVTIVETKKEAPKHTASSHTTHSTHRETKPA